MRAVIATLWGCWALGCAGVATGGDVYAPGQLAIDGYDVVAYFEEGRAARGSSRHEYAWGGVRWRFASQEHLELFQRDPERYAPQYGGYCAFGVATRQHKIRSDPTVFNIVDGKLYLNVNTRIQQRWIRNRHLFIQRADRVWPDLGR